MLDQPVRLGLLVVGTRRPGWVVCIVGGIHNTPVLLGSGNQEAPSKRQWARWTRAGPVLSVRYTGLRQWKPKICRPPFSNPCGVQGSSLVHA